MPLTDSHVDVVEGGMDAQTAVPAGWQVIEVLSIGLSDGPDPFVFGRIAAIDVDRQGRIYVLDEMNLVIRIFDSEGEFLVELGGAGGGPGEFRVRARGLQAMGLIGDSLLAVHNNWTSELILYDLQGEYHSSIHLDPITQSRGMTSDLLDLGGGQLLLHGRLGYETGPPATNHGQELLLRVDIPSWVIDTLTEYQPQDVIPYQLSRLTAELFPRPFPARHVWAGSSAGRIALGDGKSYSITIYDAMWRPVGRLTGPTMPRTVTKDDIDEFRARFPWGNGVDPLSPAMRRAVVKVVREMEFPDTWPAYDQLLYDSDAYLWVRRPPSFQEPFALWDVYDDSLRYVAETEMPRDIHVSNIQDGFIYAVSIDDEGVTSVRKYRLVR